MQFALRKRCGNAVCTCVGRIVDGLEVAVLVGHLIAEYYRLSGKSLGSGMSLSSVKCNRSDVGTLRSAVIYES